MRIAASTRIFVFRIISLLCLAVLPLASLATAQSISVQEFRPFVIGVRTVVSNGAVGGISIDAAGVVSLADEDDTQRLNDAWKAAISQASAPAEQDEPIRRPSPLRKISLRRLERALGEAAKSGSPLTPDMQFLAGLLQVKFVLVYPDQSDIVLAGPADGWRVDDQGNIVSQTTGLPTLHLEDLLIALVAADSHPGDTLRCSIDPTADGLKRVQKLVKSRRLTADDNGLTTLEETLGPQSVTIGGVPTTSRFARVMLAADYRMKRLAMGFDAPPIDRLPCFFDLFAATSGAAPRTMTPRWWLAASYQPLLRDADGLAWQLRGPGVECRTEEHRLASSGKTVRTGKTSPAAAQWAQNMTEQYDRLGQKAAVFADLHNLMDLAVVGALLSDRQLYDRCGWSLPMLRDPESVQLSEYHVPTAVPSLANLTRQPRGTVVSVSGGVEIDPWAVLQQVEEDAKLEATRRQSAPHDTHRWWWD